MKNILKYLAIIVTLSTLIGIFYFKVYIPKITYKITSPIKGDLKVSVNGIGNVSAKDIYTITAQSGGKIVTILTTEGKWVKKGDLLIQMDGVDLPQQIEIAKATLQKANYDFVASKNELKNQEIQKELLQKTYNRYTKLNKQGYVAQAEYDKALSDLNSINSMILVSKSHINSSKAQIQLSKNSIQAIQIKLNNLNVYAPIDGYVISKTAQVAQDILPTTEILKIVDAKTLWVETKIDERISGTVIVGQTAIIKLSSQPEKTYQGIVTRILPISDMVTLEREIDISFVNIPKPFYIYEQAEVSIQTNIFKNIFKISLNFISKKDNKIGVWLLKDGHAHFQTITKIAQNDDFIAISNLDENSQIIVANPNKKPLKEGMSIHL